MSVRLGLDAVLYINGVIAPNVRDLTLTLETAEADVTTRGNAGWRATVATLKDASIEWEMVWAPADVGFAAIRDAFLNRTAVVLSVMDGTGAGSQGLVATCMITNFSRSEPLEEAITVSVTAKPTYSATPPAWVINP